MARFPMSEAVTLRSVDPDRNRYRGLLVALDGPRFTVHRYRHVTGCVRGKLVPVIDKSLDTPEMARSAFDAYIRKKTMRARDPYVLEGDF